MIQLKVKGLIIKEVNVGESNKIITILTEQYGKIQAGANGARKYKSKLIAGCSLFCYSDFVLGGGKGIYRVISAEPINTFFDIRNDIETLSLATYFCDLLCETSTEGQESEDVIKLALNTFYILSKGEINNLKPVFELRLMCQIGFAPNLCRCEGCGSDDELINFSIADGIVFCANCKSANIQKGTVLAMRHIGDSELKKIFSFNVSQMVKDELEKICEDYCINHIGRNMRTLKFYKDLKNL